MEDVRRAAQARWRRNCAGTVLALTVATLLCAGGWAIGAAGHRCVPLAQLLKPHCLSNT